MYSKSTYNKLILLKIVYFSRQGALEQWRYLAFLLI